MMPLCRFLSRPLSGNHSQAKSKLEKVQIMYNYYGITVEWNSRFQDKERQWTTHYFKPVFFPQKIHSLQCGDPFFTHSLGIQPSERQSSPGWRESAAAAAGCRGEESGKGFQQACRTHEPLNSAGCRKEHQTCQWLPLENQDNTVNLRWRALHPARPQIALKFELWTGAHSVCH